MISSKIFLTIAVDITAEPDDQINIDTGRCSAGNMNIDAEISCAEKYNR